ncbi:MAG TPA: hypothetical protein VKZ82_25755 [Nonomuraea sp.]|nr:hypothetical protein [Nonomuraea sp.]
MTTETPNAANARAHHSAEYLARLASTPGATASSEFVNELLRDVQHGLSSGEYYRLNYHARLSEAVQLRIVLGRLREYASRARVEGYRTLPVDRVIEILDTADR